jgi:hypothetical protein
MEPRTGPEEEARLRQALAAGEEPLCPHCGSPMAVVPVPPRADVAYVRDRVLLLCSSCSFRAAVDRR